MIKVMIVDDHELVRAGISRLLKDESGIEVVAEAESGEQAIKLLKDHKIHVILMDVKMPGIGGLEATKKLMRTNKDLKIIALTMYDEEPLPSKLLQAGAFGYITKGSDISEMVRAIKMVYSGKKYIGPDIAQQMALKRYGDNNENPLDLLSERELQIMLMITSGQKVQDISDKLCLSPKTVNSYRYRLFEKLVVSTDVELTHIAIRHGLVDMEECD